MKSAIACFLTCLFVATGCSRVKTDYHKLDLATVTGQVKLEGAPLADAYIVFEGDDLTYSFGKTDSNGNYTLMFNTEKEGVLPGRKKVKIRLSSAFGAEGAMLDGEGAGELEGGAEEEGEAEEGASTRPVLPNELPESYHKNSHLSAEVVSGSQSINFNLKSDGSTTSPE